MPRASVPPFTMPSGLEGPENELVEAVNCVRRFRDSAKADQLHAKYFPHIGLSTFNGILANPVAILRSEAKTRDAFLDFLRDHSDRLDTIDHLFNATRNNLQPYVISDAERFLGNYHFYRMARLEDEIILGELSIYAKNGRITFQHRSTQSFSSTGLQIQFSHAGVVLRLERRIYLIGIGTHHGTGYMWSMIVGTVEDPTRREMTGLLLTETPDHIPFSARTVLVKEELTKDWLALLGKSGLDAHLRSILAEPQ
jgi:hypothetical protein